MSSCMARIQISVCRLVTSPSNCASTPISFWMRHLHKSSVLTAGQEWRRKVGLPDNPNAYGAMTDLPDYTFLDGRRTPLGSGKVKRAKEQHALAEKIMKLSSEIDFAITRREALDVDEEKQRQSILDRKLKPKGEQISKGRYRTPSLE